MAVDRDRRNGVRRRNADQGAGDELRAEPRPVGRSVRFAAQGAGYQLAARDGGLELALRDERVHVAIPGRPRAGAELPGTANYFLGDQWHVNVPTYAGIAYDDAWPGVDVAVYGTAGRFEYDLRLSPGADPGRIALRFDPPARLGRGGSLRVGGLTQPPPVTRQGDRAIPSHDRVPAGRRAGADHLGDRQAQASGGEIPRSDSGRGPKIRRSLSLIATSLMLASRRRM
jgi:hypothetical protein